MKTPRSLLALALLGCIALVARADQKTRTLDIHWIDSEGGGSTLIVTPAGESVLIDTGNPGGRDPARIIAAAKAAGLTRIDFMLLTHYHLDHFGGAAEVAAQIPFGKIYQRDIPSGDPDGRAQSPFANQIKPYREIPAPRVALAAGVTIPLKQTAGTPTLALRCLGADQKFISPNAAQVQAKNPLVSAPREVAPSDNDNCAVFVLEFGAFRFFDGGDLTWNLEAQLVSPVNLVGPVSVYQTNHHGLAVSNNPILVQSLAPHVVVMNNGPRKGGAPEAFAAIKSAASVRGLYQIHRSMNAPADNAPDEFIANLPEARPADTCAANPIKLSVAPGGAAYTITIPANGHTRTYPAKQ
ncbi:MAG: hypothetical protein RLZZ15_1279 [Verrucomicrobiota bacterium]|jgi:beta-lactamase superfamily II metal-dependent hydrolase